MHTHVRLLLPNTRCRCQTAPFCCCVLDSLTWRCSHTERAKRRSRRGHKGPTPASIAFEGLHNTEAPFEYVSAVKFVYLLPPVLTRDERPQCRCGESALFNKVGLPQL